MAKMVFQRSVLGFVPADEVAEKFCQKTKQGEFVMVEARKPRNIQHHRKLFLLLNRVCDNLDNVPVEKLLTVIKIRTGYTEVIRTRRGEIEIPKSISFEAMSQEDFEQFYERTIAFILSDVLPGVNRRDLEDEVLRLVA